MKKLLGIVVLGLLMSFNSVADDQIYYCSDEAVAGFDVDEFGTKNLNYEPQRWKAKIDLDKGIFKPDDMGLTSGWKNAGAKNYFSDGVMASIRFYEDMKYFRSSLFGPRDSIFVAFGNCSKF